MFFGTPCANRALQFVFASLTLLFALLAIGNFTGNHGLLTIAGYEGIICGASAIYLAMAEVLNAQFGRTVLPIGARAGLFLFSCHRACTEHYRLCADSISATRRRDSV